MTETEKRIAIAKESGFESVWKPHSPRVCGSELVGHKHGDKSVSNVPDYFHDANAALELTALLAKEGWRCDCNMGLDSTWECEFWREAQSAATPHNIGERAGVKIEIHYGAGDTLAQAICESFLRQCGLWKE